MITDSFPAMKILVANLGSTSFKYRLFDLSDETQLARGGIDRIGESESQCVVEIGDYSTSSQQHIADHAQAVQMCLQQLTDPQHGCLDSVSDVSGIGFKAVFAGRLSGVRIVDETLLNKMEECSVIAPAHNPPYVKAMRQLRTAFPEIPLVAALETGFHETIPFEHRAYAVPYEWYSDLEIRRWGYHGASHRFIAGRTAELLERDDRALLKRCRELGPQGGLPNNTRVGDFDPYALPVIMQATGKTLEEVLSEMSSRGGLLGVSGLSGDCRDLEEAAADGHERAELALRLFEASIRSHVGSYMAVLGGADVVVFTGGIGENSDRIRSRVCADMDWAGLQLCPGRNENVSRGQECRISTDDSRTEVWVIPTNEELVVARQTAAVIG